MVRKYRDPKTELVASIIKNNLGRPIKRLLVVGCGTGVEAAILSRCLEAEVVGVDIVEDFSSDAKSSVMLKKDDAMALSFDDSSFDFIYSYHALEHIPDAGLALKEMNRVLTPGGHYWIGTPNRSRMIGYLGSKDATLSEKVKWNLIDWKAKISGKFHNEHGAHAGYSRTELKNMLLNNFSSVSDMTDTYFYTLYGGHKRLLDFLCFSRLSTIAYPSIYFMGTK